MGFKAGLKRKVDLEEGQQKKALQQVLLWLSMAEAMITEAEELERDGPQQVQKLLAGDISNYMFVGRVAKKLEDLIALKAKGDFKEVVERTLPEPVVVRNVNPTVGTETLRRGMELHHGRSGGNFWHIRLVDYWICENFGDRNESYSIIGSLVGACLLEEQGEHVKMHDVIRDMALWIACYYEKEKHKFFVKAGAQLTQVPETLNEGIARGNIKIELLQYLNLSRTLIRQLPVELKMLVNLKYLNLEGNIYLNMIPRGVISSLSSLQVLEMYNVGILEGKLRLKDLTWVILAPRLTHLLVGDNKHIEEIVSVEKLDDVQVGDENFNPFFKLEYLDLEELPELKSIYPKALSFPSLERINVYKCPQLKKLPLNSSSANGGKVKIEAEERWWKDVEWEDDSTKTTFLPCFVPSRRGY
ncbi:hypothetical protein GH714_028353 [Hevea brasiliensis]|uniref:Disease resistance protein At4g27190-like leucine-rich repeats domain-containing protein n=1 Tax=Hevea brasiliensis TaxID=3981 RepID=A0A6A6LNB8_HEVBR|nr:hypothetical protein GH714_028353 [Hevea brasiliensis]